MYINIDSSNKNIKEYIDETITSLIEGGGISLSSLGVTASSTELNYCKGVTSSIQTQLNNKAASNHTHSNYITTNASCNKNWNWSGQSGQPYWLWGSNDGVNMYVWNPKGFHVAQADAWGPGTAAGIGENLLANHNIGSTLTLNDLVHSGKVMFFTNWNDSGNFPELYGSGVFIPGLDSNAGYILYMAGGRIYKGWWKNSGGLRWFWHDAVKEGLK